MAISRRQFIRRTGLATAGTLLGPSLFASPFVRRAFANLGDRYLVVIFLDGGNDGLNTVIPVTNGGGSLRTDYEAHRFTGGGGIRITPAQLAGTAIANDPNTGASLALHPGLSGFKDLYDAGRLAVIQGCGYPEYSLSHEESRIIWQSANPLRSGLLTGTGWVGRHLAATYPGTQIPGVCISNSIAPDFRQSTTSVLAINEVENFQFPWDSYGGDQLAKAGAFEDLHANASAGAQATQVFIGNVGSATIASTQNYPALQTTYESTRSAFSQLYADIDRSTAYDLREVAKIINGVRTGVMGVSARFFSIDNGGYDTHSDQGGATGQHYDLHREVGDSLKVFYDDLADMGVADKVLTVVWSEFARRIEQNGSGTDHGSQGPMFVIGGVGAINGGVYGNHPNINNLDLEDDGNTVYRQTAHPFRSTDFRDVFGTILKHWLNMTQPQILSNILHPDAAVGEYWSLTNGINLDMGFLS
ncbi:MAG: DUF1501 domain-containing protein [Deltaproteobacteria bacterium]|nr:DUF1501 domain-containing protein [Deltaproteobacteria bacterium]